MSDTCNKNMTESFESVNIAIALHKVLSEEWLFAKHVKTGWIIGLNKSFKEIRDMLSDSLPNSLPTGLCVMSKSLTEGSLNTEFKFISKTPVMKTGLVIMRMFSIGWTHVIVSIFLLLVLVLVRM